jgi:predicted enzyme related to lactoylglutathione lyase
MNAQKPILELRVALTTQDYDRLVQFYCAGLGLEPSQVWNNGQGKGLVIDMGAASLELFDETQARIVDQIETGRTISSPVRFALQVPDLKAAIQRLQAAGANQVSDPVVTPWGDYNVRFQDPDGMQVTLFQKPAE